MKLNDLFLLDKGSKAPVINQTEMKKLLKKIYEKEHGDSKTWDSDVKASYKQSKAHVKKMDPYTIRAFRSILKNK